MLEFKRRQQEMWVCKVGNPSLLGLSAAALAGIFFGLSDALVRAASARLTPLQNLFISLVVGTPLLWAAAVYDGLAFPPFKVAMLWVLAGLANFVLGRLLFYTSITYAGASTAAVAASPTSAFSALLAWAFLGEEITLRQLVGLFIFVIAVYIASVKPSGEALHGGKSVIGVLSGVAAALAFSASTLLVRMAGGYEQADPLVGVAISYTSALPIVVPLTLAKEKRVEIGRHTWYMVVASASVALAQLLRYLALALMPVVYAVVLMGLFPFHTFLFAHMLPREAREKPQLRHGIAAALATLGVILVNIS
jgi:drug/metabolite transporter (DMT)-like permease